MRILTISQRKRENEEGEPPFVWEHSGRARSSVGMGEEPTELMGED